MAAVVKNRRVLPGFGLALGYTVTYLSIVVLLPLAAMVVTSVRMGWSEFWAVVLHERTLSAYRLSLGASAAAAVLNVVIGLLIAWVLVRYSFPFRRTIDALIDLPFALPTAVAGIALLYLYSPRGWIGKLLKQIGFSYPWPQWRGFGSEVVGGPIEWRRFDSISSTPLGVVMALSFVGLPFVVRTVQPVLEEMDKDAEEVSASLGSTRWHTFRKVVFPQLRPALLTGFALSFARGLGEFGSVIFIAGKSESTMIAPFDIIDRSEQHDYAGANAVAVGLLLLSFAILLVLNIVQRRLARHGLS